MILRIKRAHLVLKTTLGVMRLLSIDVIHQCVQIRRTGRKQSIPALPRECRDTPLLHPCRRSRLDLRNNFGGPSRRRQPQSQMHMIGDTADTKTFTTQLSRRAGKVCMKIVEDGLIDQGQSALRTENDMHQVEAQRLRHGADYMSGFQPSTHAVRCDLGLRPRLVCGRTFGPSTPIVHTISQNRNRHRGHHV